MAIVYGGQMAIPEREYLFIDGGCLRATVRAINSDLGLPDGALIPLYSAFGAQADKVFYYDAISAQWHGEQVPDYEARIQTEHDAFDQIRALDRFHVALGEVKGKGRNRRQKQVDVRLAVDMLTHTFRGNIQRATLFAGDDDFIPLVEALVREGLTITVWHPPQASEALLSAADIRRPFNLSSAHSFLSANGRTPAFQQQNSGTNAIIPHIEGSRASWTEGAYRYEAQWKDQRLIVFRSQQGTTWEYQVWSQDVGGPEHAVAFIERVHGWQMGAAAGDALRNYVPT